MYPVAVVDLLVICVLLFCHTLNQDYIFESHTVRNLKFTGGRHLHILRTHLILSRQCKEYQICVFNVRQVP